MGYSRGIRGVFTGYTYVSVMYRLCVGNVTEQMRSEGVNKEDNIDNYSASPTLLSGEGIYLSTIKNNLESTMRTKNILWRERQEI